MRILLALLLILLPTAVVFPQAATQPPVVNARVAPVLQINGLQFKDLNKNSKLDVYEDWRRPVEDRVNDLVAQMTVEEKAGLMVGPSLAAGPGGTVGEKPVIRPNPFNPGPPMLTSPGTTDGISTRHIRQFILREELTPGDVVIQRGTNHAWGNRTSELARMLFILLDGKFAEGSA